MNSSTKRKLLLLAILLGITVLFAINKGSVAIPFLDLFAEANRPILYLRLTGIMLGIFAGAGLSVCGVVLQAILRNPLAEPYLLGTSSGAGLGAVIAVILGVSSAYLPFVAFCGALVSIILVYTLAREDSKLPMQSLILCGVIVAVALSGLVVFLVSVSSSEALPGILWWILGSLQIYEFKLLLMVGVLVALGTICISIFAQDINTMSIGEEEAIHSSHLDIGHQIQILDLLKRLNQEKNLCAVVVLHDLNLASEYCHRLILLNEGRIIKEGEPAEVLTYQIIEAVYKTVVVKQNPISSKPYVVLVSEQNKYPPVLQRGLSA